MDRKLHIHLRSNVEYFQTIFELNVDAVIFLCTCKV